MKKNNIKRYQRRTTNTTPTPLQSYNVNQPELYIMIPVRPTLTPQNVVLNPNGWNQGCDLIPQYIFLDDIAGCSYIGYHEKDKQDLKDVSSNISRVNSVDSNTSSACSSTYTDTTFDQFLTRDTWEEENTSSISQFSSMFFAMDDDDSSGKNQVIIARQPNI